MRELEAGALVRGVPVCAGGAASGLSTAMAPRPWLTLYTPIPPHVLKHLHLHVMPMACCCAGVLWSAGLAQPVTVRAGAVSSAGRDVSCSALSVAGTRSQRSLIRTSKFVCVCGVVGAAMEPLSSSRLTNNPMPGLNATLFQSNPRLRFVYLDNIFDHVLRYTGFPTLPANLFHANPLLELVALDSAGLNWLPK